MTYGGTCSCYGRIIAGTSWREPGPPDEHRVTCFLPCRGCQSRRYEKYSGTPWIAIRAGKLIFTVTHNNEEHAKLDLFDICRNPYYNMAAVVSSNIGYIESQDGRGIAASLAEFNERLASNFLIKALKRRTFTFQETLQITISAFCRLFPGNIKANEIQFFAMTNDLKIAFPVEEVEALLENKNDNFNPVLSPLFISLLQEQGILDYFPIAPVRSFPQFKEKEISEPSKKKNKPSKKKRRNAKWSNRIY